MLASFLKQIYAIQEVQIVLERGELPSPMLLEQAGLGGVEPASYSQLIKADRQAASPHQPDSSRDQDFSWAGGKTASC